MEIKVNNKKYSQDKLFDSIDLLEQFIVDCYHDAGSGLFHANSFYDAKYDNLEDIRLAVKDALGIVKYWEEKDREEGIYENNSD